MSLKDCTSRYLAIPCGHCDECIALKQMYIVQRVQMESLSNYLFYCTLTYNRKSLPHVETSSGYSIPFADVHDIQNFFKSLRNHNSFSRPFRYLYVSERGGKKGRPHFHILFFVPKYETDNEFIPINIESIGFKEVLKHWSRRVSSSKKTPVYEPCCTYQEIWRNGKRISNYDFHYVKPLVDEDSFSNVAFYVTKYMLKPSDKDTKLQQALKLNLSFEEYESIWKLVRSRTISSKGFGLHLDEDGNIDPKILSHLRYGVAISKDFPKFFNPQSGKSFPLSRYYRNKSKIYSFDDAIRFYFESDSDSIDSPIIKSVKSDKDYAQLLKHESDYEKKVNSVSERGDFDSYSDEFD